MKITALIENLPLSDEIQVEHGLSLYIEADGKKILSFLTNESPDIVFPG